MDPMRKNIQIARPGPSPPRSATFAFPRLRRCLKAMSARRRIAGDSARTAADVETRRLTNRSPPSRFNTRSSAASPVTTAPPSSPSASARAATTALGGIRPYLPPNRPCFSLIANQGQLERAETEKTSRVESSRVAAVGLREVDCRGRDVPNVWRLKASD